MMQNPTYLLFFGLVMFASGFKISTNCVNQCKNESSIRCNKPCNYDIQAISLLRLIYGEHVIDTFTKTCHCEKHEYVYPDDKIFNIIYRFAVLRGKEGCQCKQGTKTWNDNLTEWKIENPRKLVRKDHVINYLIQEKVGSKIRNLRLRNDGTTINPWENWCKRQCADGLGGSACYCDILP